MGFNSETINGVGTFQQIPYIHTTVHSSVPFIIADNYGMF